MGKFFSPRQLEILGFLAIGKSNQEIADELLTNCRVIERHLSIIIDQAEVNSRVELVEYAVRNRIGPDSGEISEG